MKLIIDIDDKVYNDLKNRGLTGMLTSEECECMNKSIYDGTPLPKGHGRLIDADVLVDGFEDNYEFCEEVNATPTIIESDKGE